MNNNFNYLIVGGGTAGWLTALFVKEKFPYSNVTVIASSEIGILGAGEGTTMEFVEFLKDLNISPNDIIKHAKGTIKKAIKFTNWNDDNKYYWQPFSAKFGLSIIDQLCNKRIVNYNRKFEKQDMDALHFDARLFAKYLQSVSISRGIKLIDDEVIDVVCDENNQIKSLVLRSNHQISCDFVFDCSGFKRLIIGKHFKSKWNCYKKMLPMKRAMPFFLDNTKEENLPPYTEAIAMKYGWMWKIPVQGRYGCGYVYDSDYVSDEDIKLEIEGFVRQDVEVPKIFNFDAGCYEDTWINNCVAVGLSAGFVEPLEATSIWMQILSLKFLLHYIDGIIFKDQKIISRYNKDVKNLNLDTMNFLYFHYLVKRKDSKFWQEFRHITEPTESIKQLLEISKNRIPTKDDFDYLKSIDSDRSGINLSYSIRSLHIIGLANEIYNPKLELDLDVNKGANIDISDFITHSEFLTYANR